jgi:predicted PurR-regulated permease PerM
MMGILNIIPTFGPMIGGAIGIFVLVLDKPINALWFFIFICIWQSIDGMIIKPRLFKGSLGLPAVWTLVLIILGGKIAGMAGIILAIPIAAILVILYHETVEPRLNKRIGKLNAGEKKDEPVPAPEQPEPQE